jgi:hypothetical protein
MGGSIDLTLPLAICEHGLYFFESVFVIFE